MNSELDILIDIYADLSHNLEHIKSSKTNMIKIKNNITNHSNNYFDTHCECMLLNDYLKMFDSIETYNELVNNLESLKLVIKSKIRDICQHNWVEDYIDINPDRSQKICYCNECGVTKK